MKATARPLLSAVRARTYCAQAAASDAKIQAQEQKHLKADIGVGSRVTRLPNGALVAGLENYSPVIRMAILYNAGSRYETPETKGITHVLRNATNLSSKNATAFGITKHLQQMGAELTATTSKEVMMISVNCNRDVTSEALDFLSHVARHPAYKPWEVRDDLAEHLHQDIAKLQLEPENLLMEALHEAAYRDTLGNSLYIPEHKIGSYNYEDLRAFAADHFQPSNMAIVALGVGETEINSHVNRQWGFDKDTTVAPVPPKVKATYYGGERRIDLGSQLVHAAIVTEGASLGSKDLIPLAVLQRIMGTGPSLKYSETMGASKISKAFAGSGTQPFTASAININYSDSGLFGFFALAQPNEIGKVLKTLAGAFGSVTKGGITEEELTAAKNKLKAAIWYGMEDQETLMTEIGLQALLTGKVIGPDQLLAEVDKVTVAGVQEVAKRVINGKPSMSAVGNIANTPYLDQIL